MKIYLVMLGKTRRPECRALIDDYLDRIRRWCPIEARELRASGATEKIRADPAATWVLLDAGGRQFTSAEFARWLAELRDRGTREIVFLCGDADGFPPELRGKAQARLALSPLTLSHELARVVLAEQIYRAFAILAGHPYPK